MSGIEYEFQPGTPEQVEFFIDLQRLIVKMYNEWPADQAIAIVGASLGCVVALIETQHKLHVEGCAKCQGADPLDLAETARANFEHYYSMEMERALVDQRAAEVMVKNFFKGDH